MAKTKTIKYSEPAGYFPKSVREKHGIGEYAKTTSKKKTTAKKKK